VHIPAPPFGRAGSIDEAKQSFKAAWLAFEAKHAPAALAAAYAAMNIRDEPWRCRVAAVSPLRCRSINLW
jgi:hypothetical protein